MKILKCVKCERQQKEGKYCLDCGNELKEIITSEVKFRPIRTNRTSERLKKDIRNWLSRIGVQQPDIRISTGDGKAEVEYILSRVTYNFSSLMQDKITDNLAAVEQFLHYRVLGIERGIETVEKAFAGYEALPDLTNKNPYDILGLPHNASIQEAKIRFKKLSKTYHPDVNKSANASKEFDRIRQALKKIEGSETQ